MSDEIEKCVKKHGLYINNRTELTKEITDKLTEYNINKYLVIGVDNPRFEIHYSYNDAIVYYVIAIGDYNCDIFKIIKTETDNGKITFYYKDNRIAICNNDDVNKIHIKYNIFVSREEKLKRILYE
jgi:peroxiredoxin